jgi:hypothetical protein
MNDKEKELKMAWLNGKDKRERGANALNCHFSIFSSPQKTKAWEFGEQGKPFNLKAILLAAL